MTKRLCTYFVIYQGFNQPRFVKKYILITIASMPSELCAIGNNAVLTFWYWNIVTILWLVGICTVT